jgi:putative ABC transport system permease protein
VGRAALFARALWWRRGLGAAVLVVATITTAVAALGPLYAEAAAQSTLTDRLVATPSAQTGLSFTQRADLSEPGAIGSLLTQLPAPGSVRAYPSRITGTNIPVTARTGQLLSLTTLVSRPGFCAHLIVLSGRCPTSPHEAIVDDNALHGRPNWALGQVVTVTYGTSEAAFGPLLDQVKIVGSYRPIDTDDPFWFGRAFFTAHESPVAIPDQLNAMFVADSENSVLPPGTIGGVEADYPLAAGQVRLATIGSLQRDVARIQQRFPAAGPTSGAGPAMRTALASVLDESRADHHQVDVDTLLVIAELTILAWIALFGVVADSIGARGSDIALAKLRGHSRAAVLVMTVAEPVALVVLALPLGLLLALGVAHQLADSVLVAGTPVVLTPAVAGALGAAFAGGALAALIAARSVLARPVLEQWRNTTSSLNQGRASRWTLLAELALVVLAVTGVVVLRSSGGSPSTLALAAPGVLLFAIAIAGARFIPAAVRLRLRSSIGSSRVALFVALRQLVRRRAGLRLASLLAVSVGLASFAIAAETVAAGNRSARAQTELGAPTVASVQFQPQHDPQTIVAQVDSTGSWAMAAATWLPDGGAPSAGPASVVGTVLAVDPARLAATGTDVRGQPTMAAIAASITVPSAVP